ncbi:MAG TPA: DUF1592 domain-containing protein [Gemmataceae bacterium]|nr:DUF1592 domain-containing protein [Gemmataceae bacterium]
MRLLLPLAVLSAVTPWATGADSFQERIKPFAEKYCKGCHNKEKPRGELDLTRYTRDVDVTSDFRRWNHVLEFVRKGAMPPNDKPQPTIEERKTVVAAIESILLVEARKHAGDPGVVLPRRLSTTEYDLSIRDLTGFDLRATAEFPIDPAGGEGFNNTGEALGMTPNLLNKYLEAARFVSEHLVLKPNGIAFAPFPVTSYNERKKLTEQAIIDFYRQHEVRIDAYLEAAWRYQHRVAGDRDVSLDAWATRSKLSGKYLTLVAKTLDEAKTGTGYLKQLGEKWPSLPAPKNASDVPQEMKEFQRLVSFLQSQLCQREPRLIHADAGCWVIGHLDLRAKAAFARDKFDSANLKSRQLIKFGRLETKTGEKPSETMLYLRIDPAFEGLTPGTIVVRQAVFTKSDTIAQNKKQIETQGMESLRAVLEREAPEVALRFGFGKHPSGGVLDADTFAVPAPGVLEIPLSSAAVAALQGKQLLLECELDGDSSTKSAFHLLPSTGKRPESTLGTGAGLVVRPESQLAKDIAASGEKFCSAFPNRFFYVDPNRNLTAGFHLVEGLFRDDQPLMGKVLTESERTELDRLWKELDFVTQRTETLLRGFVWFERAERHVIQDKRFDYLSSDDPLLVENELLSKFERMYLEKLGVKLVDGELKPEKASSQFELIHGFFQEVRQGLAAYKQTLERVETTAIADLERLAQQAYGRPLRADETAALRALYQKLRKQGQGVEDSLRGTIRAVLMSPHFFFHIPAAPAGEGIYPLAGEALARRLSYFLWSSLPDEELLKAAREGKLQDEQVLRGQVQRMLKDPKSAAFAREFFGQWLRYRDYLSKDAIPAGAFPGYDDSLRRAFFEEPTRLITDLIQQDRDVDELLHGDATFVNAPLAQFYGGSIETQYRRLSTERAEDRKRRGLPAPTDANADWYRVDGLRSLGRGGVFGIPVILTTNSAGQRTSPVKRGFWVVHHLLGEHFPPPPADVPELPKTEKESSKTIREMLAEHTAHAQCAMCHVHFDGLGLTMEGFDAIGRSRTKDLAGRAIQSVGPLPGGKTAEGIGGLIDYVENQRRGEFERNLCRKFLGYALGRSVVLSDEPLLDEMQKNLHEKRRFSALFETVVLSPQFRKQRGRDYRVRS